MKKKNPAAGAPMSIRLADDLKRELEAAALKLKMDTHQVMRLAMEVGLEHFTRIDHDLAACVVERIASGAQSKASLIAKADKDLLASPACVENAASKSTSPTSKPASTSTAQIVHVPKPPMLKTVVHDSLQVAEPPTPYVIKKKRTGTED